MQGGDAYYNEHDPYAAEWLRNLIAAGLIPAGDVDERDIEKVSADEIKEYRQCHFFAGIGGWPLGLRLAGWPDDRPVWTGSVPCQPYSVASVAHGGAQGQGDERHLLPVFSDLVGECRPPVVFGEQVRAAIEWGWLDEAAGRLEKINYAFAALVLPAYLVGADHERFRVFWVAHTSGQGRKGYKPIESVSVAAKEAFSVTGNPFSGARRVLEGDHSNLRDGYGISVAVERCATKGYGNAIVPQAAEKFIAAYMEAA